MPLPSRAAWRRDTSVLWWTIMSCDSIAAPRSRIIVRADNSPAQRTTSASLVHAQKGLSCRNLGTLTADPGEVPQSGPVHRGLRRGDARPVPRHPDAERGWGDRTSHRRRDRYGLAFDPDRDLA